MDGVTDIALRELGLSAVPTLTEGEVMRVLRHLAGLPAEGDLVDAFESSYAKERAAAARKTPTPETVWTFYWPLGIRLADDITERPVVTILGTRFRFSRTKTVMQTLGVRQLGPTSLKVLLHPGRQVGLPPVFLVASTKAPNFDEGWRRLIPAFDTIRGVMEYGLGFGRVHLFFQEPTPRAYVPHPQWMLAKTRGQPVQGVRFITEARDDVAPSPFGDKHLRLIRRLGQEFRTIPREGSTLALIADALRLYAQAMDERHRHMPFLALWQLAERITLAEASQGRTTEVCSRLRGLVRDFDIPGSGLSHTVDALARMRNDIVHRGIRGSVDDDDVNLLKRIAEHGLLWLIHRHRELPNQADVAVFYQLRSAPTGELRSHGYTVRFIARLRAKEAPRPAKVSKAPRNVMVQRPEGPVSA
jgi:hypothetical protein